MKVALVNCCSPRFRIRTLLVLIAIIACVLAVANRAWRIHYSALLIEVNGGNVWLGETLYSGERRDARPRTSTQLLLDRARVVTDLIRGAETDLWVCFVPEDRKTFAQVIELLRPKSISFDVLGASDRQWLRRRFPELNIRTVQRKDNDDDDEQPLLASDVKRPSNSAASAEIARRDPFIHTLELIEQMLAEDYRLAYRLERYEPLIGYPDHGEMGRLLDRDTGRIIYLPWPK
jgi:hypothetical protein